MSNTVTITGTLTDITGTPTEGQVVITLQNYTPQPPIISGSDVIADTQITVQAASNGTWSVTLFLNSAITPANTFYKIALSPAGSTAPAIVASYAFNTSGTFDLSNLTPLVVLPSPATLTYGAAGPAGPAGATGATGAAGAQGNPGTTNVPWADIQAYGSMGPKGGSYALPTAGCTTVATSPDVTLASGSFASRLANGQGICIWAAGAATSQSTPSAPTATSPCVQGSQTITYECVGYDAMGGLTAASASGTCTDAPAVFGCIPVAISSAAVSSDVLTVNFSSPLNNSVAEGMTIHLVGMTGSGATWNGVYQIATAPTTSQITVALTTADGSATVTHATGRLSNSVLISSASRDASGVLTLTFATDHNFHGQSGLNNTVISVEGLSPVDLNGIFSIYSGTADTIVCHTGIMNAENASVTAGAYATVWEFINVACPALSGTTVGYYIYSDSPNPGGDLVLIGKCVYGECHFTDWGPSIMAGYAAPAYVPTSPPASAQNKMFTSTVKSGGGTTSIVLNNNVPTSIGSLGATIMFDDGPNIVAAAAACGGSDNLFGSVFLSPSQVDITYPGYVINSPITIPAKVGVIFGAHCIVNETVTFTELNNVTGQFGSTINTNTSSAGQRSYVDIGGLGNPMFCLGTGSSQNGSITLDGLGFTNYANGLCGVQIQGTLYNKLSNVAFTSSSGSYGTAIGLILNGNCSFTLLDETSFAFTNQFSNANVVGQSYWGPPIPALWVRCSDNPNIPNYSIGASQFVMRGKHSWTGRGILFDHKWATGSEYTHQITIGDMMWIQLPVTPTIMFWGQLFTGIEIHNILNDTSTEAIVANWAINGTYSLYLYNSNNSASYPLVTGAGVNDLFVTGSSAQYQAQLQRMTGTSFTTTSGTSDVVSVPNYNGGWASLTPTNASAVTGGAYISSKGTGTITVTHNGTSGMTFDILAAVGN